MKANDVHEKVVAAFGPNAVAYFGPEDDRLLKGLDDEIGFIFWIHFQRGSFWIRRVCPVSEIDRLSLQIPSIDMSFRLAMQEHASSVQRPCTTAS